MYPFRLLSLCLLAASLAAGSTIISSASNVAKPVGTPAETDRSRVIVRVDGNTEIKGYLELEEDDVLVIRDMRGEVQSFARGRFLEAIILVEPEPGQTGVVMLRNGQVRQGVIIEDAFDYVLLEIEGVRAKLKREVVDYVRLEPTFEQLFADYKASIKPGMAQRHLALCKWLADERRYELAATELEELLTNHDLPKAVRLLTIVEAQLALREKPTNSDTQENEVEPDTRPDQFLTPEDVNIIRVYEIDFDHAPRIVITKKTVRKIIERYSDHELIPPSETGRSAMYRAKPLELVHLLFSLRAREIYPEIQVLTEPRSLNRFRLDVHNTWLMNNCTTSRCHGGTEAGRLFLHNRNYRDARVRYTNFLILERLELDPIWPLINYEKPTDSLIIQHGLPRELARRPHPPAKGWKPAFRRTTDRMVGETVQWIESMLTPRPDYPVQFEPPSIGDDESDKETEPSANDDSDPAGR